MEFYPGLCGEELEQQMEYEGADVEWRAQLKDWEEEIDREMDRLMRELDARYFKQAEKE